MKNIFKIIYYIMNNKYNIIKLKKNYKKIVF